MTTEQMKLIFQVPEETEEDVEEPTYDEVPTTAAYQRPTRCILLKEAKGLEKKKMA